MNTQAIIVVSTFPSKESAIKAGQGAVTLSLAACAQISSEIESIYKWKGKLCNETEFQISFKTTVEQETELYKFIKSNHPYEVAEIISIPISRLSIDYLSWLEKNSTGVL